MAAAEAKDDILKSIQRIILSSQRCFNNEDVDCQIILQNLQNGMRSLNSIKESLDLLNFRAIHSAISGLIDQIQLKMRNNTESFSFSAPRGNNLGNGGRPKVNITEDQLKMLHNLNFTAKQMAEHFQCSPEVVYRRLKAIGLHQRDKYSTMSDEELDIEVQELQKKFPNAGSVMMYGLLRTKGIQVQRKRVRDSISRVCPVPVAQRLGTTVSRRQYQVHMSNSLWHMDGHMKLARWGISTHGCIDGYSRIVVFLKADINNKAKTVLQHFVNACEQYGIPSRVRSDYGKENIMVSMFITMVNGQDRHSHITGRSVHNQRVERLWRDVHSQVIQQYYDKFYRMEDQGLLDPENK
ncbi:uncharacterized protein LOC133205891 [Saccostrea echinata]|uniref:uncharacterized protein LOC133205891 n=1 Tax=Saccostrea echinata TaxID=191078 RepID=UPI002A7EFD44|nr:uncharacterized protein LOC133205891 [Saccostrea echinata]